MKKRPEKKDYVTFEDLKRAARGTPEDAQELIDANREHRAQERRSSRARRRRG